MVLWHGMGNFAGTAEFYDQYRPGVTQEVIDIIMAAVPQPAHLLDLGCGTGRVLAQFAPLFEDAIAVEPDHDMLKLARRRLQGAPVEFIHDTAEAAQLPAGWQASLVMICRAFHWMDRPKVLQKLDEAILPHGTLALVSDHSFWHLPDMGWSEVVQGTIKEFLGPERQTVTGAYQAPAEFFQEALEHSAFPVVEQHLVPVERQWSLDEIVGYLYSTSFASKAVLGSRADAFEKLLRNRLLEYAPSGIYTERNRFEIILAKRSV